MKKLLFFLFAALMFFSCVENDAKYLGTMNEVRTGISVAEQHYGLVNSSTGKMVVPCRFTSVVSCEEIGLVKLIDSDKSEIFVTSSGEQLKKISSIADANKGEVLNPDDYSMYGVFWAICAIVAVIAGIVSLGSYRCCGSVGACILGVVGIIVFGILGYNSRDRHFDGEIVNCGNLKGLVLEGKQLLPCEFEKILDFDDLVTGIKPDSTQVFVDIQGGLYTKAE